MKIFFSIDLVIKKSVIERIKKFQISYLNKGGAFKNNIELAISNKVDKTLDNSHKPFEFVKPVKKHKIKQDSKKQNKKNSKKVKDAFGIKKKVEFLEDIME